jgi:hypothetical protein
MNRSLLRLAALVFFLVAGMGNASAQVHGPYIYGYWRCVFMTGSNLFNNPCQSGSNALSQLFPNSPYSGATPEGTTVSLWNPATSSFASTSTFINGSWSVNMILPPGMGALVAAPMPFTNTIQGYVLGHDGSPITNEAGLGFPPPPLHSGPNGVYLLGDKAPVVGNAGTNIFINILGRLPYTGEQIASLSVTCTYLGHGMWDSVPTLGVGEAAFFNIISEPAPSLTIIYTKNQAVVSWPSSASDWTLQTNNNLAEGTWGNYLGSVVNSRVTDSPPTANVFFRLSYP